MLSAHLSTLWPMSCSAVLRPAVYLLPRHQRCWRRNVVRGTWPTPTREQHVWLNYRRQNSKILSNALLRCTWSRHTLNAEHSRPLFFDCYGQVGKVVVKVVESTQCRRSRTATATIDADIRCCRRRIDNRVTACSSGTDVATVQLYALPSTSPTCRWLRGSVNPSSSILCRSDHVPPSSTHPWRHGLLTPRRDPSLRPLPRRHLPTVNDNDLVPAPRASNAACRLCCIYF